jgi:hypothetical protein
MLPDGGRRQGATPQRGDGIAGGSENAFFRSRAVGIAGYQRQRSGCLWRNSTKTGIITAAPDADAAGRSEGQ